MLDPGVLRREKRKDKVDRLPVDSVKVDRFFQPHENTDNPIKSADAGVGQRDAVAHARGAKAFALLQGVHGLRDIEPVDCLRNLCQILEKSLLARRMAHDPDGGRL